MVGREDKRTNNRTMLLALKKTKNKQNKQKKTVAGYQGPVKIEVLKGAGLLLKIYPMEE